MSFNGFDIKEAAQEVAKGLTNVGQSIEASMNTYVALRREQKEAGQKIANDISDGIKGLVTELRKINES